MSASLVNLQLAVNPIPNRNSNRKSKGNRAKHARASDLSGADCAVKAYNVTRQLVGKVGPLLSLLNIESKYSDTIIGGTAFGLGIGQQVLLSGLSLGQTATTRNGQSVKWNHIEFDFMVSMGTVAAVTYARILLVKDNAPNAATFAVGDLFQAPVTGTDYTTSRFNVGNRERFSIMYDVMMDLNSSKTLSYHFQMARSLSFHTYYNTGNAGTIADITSDALYFIALSNQAVNTPTITGSLRVNFVDN